MNPEIPLVQAALSGPTAFGAARLTVVDAPGRPVLPGERIRLRLYTEVHGPSARLSVRLMWDGWQATRGYLGDSAQFATDSDEGAVQCSFTADSTSVIDLDTEAGADDAIRCLRPFLQLTIADSQVAKELRTTKVTGGAVVLRHALARPARILCRDTDPVRVDLLEGSLGCTGVEALTTPWHGSAELLPDGSVAYQPVPGHTGHDRFTATLTTLRGPVLRVPVTVLCGPLPEGGEGLLTRRDEPGGRVSLRHWQPCVYEGDMPWQTAPPESDMATKGPGVVLPRPTDTTG